MAKPMGLSYGPYPLTPAGVKNVSLTSAGVYAIGERGVDGVFYIDYVGRADNDLAGRICDHVTRASPQFHYSYCASPDMAYDRECQLYHDFTPPQNLCHPAKPKGSSRKCPVCLS